MGPRERKMTNRPMRGAGAPTIADVAKYSGFSPMTVSRVINDEANVKSSTRLAVQAAIAKLNYSPNLAARSLAGVKQPRIVLVYSNPSAAYLSRLLVGSLQQARSEHAQLVLEQIDADNPLPALREVLENEIDGIVLPPPLCDDAKVLDLVTKSGLRAAMIANWRPEHEISVVRIDDVAAAQTMTSHLIGLGHSRIGFIVGAPQQKASHERLLGYRCALEEAGLPIREELIVQGHFTFRSGLSATETLLELSKPPTAIFASNDDMAAAAVTVAHRRHLDVPHDLTVVGFDDTDFALSIWPELTTIRQPIADMAAAAVKLVAEAVRSDNGGNTLKCIDQVLDYALIRRGSDCPPARG
jgi:LacI family transcriptional regulator